MWKYKQSKPLKNFLIDCRRHTVTQTRPGIHMDSSTHGTEVLFVCLRWRFMVHGWARPVYRSILTPQAYLYPMCPGSVSSALLFLESTFILILITNSSACDFHPSALAQVWKHLRLTRYNSGLTLSSRHETISASFLFHWYTKKKFPFDFFLLATSSPLCFCLPFCFLSLLFSVYIVVFFYLCPPSISRLFISSCIYLSSPLKASFTVSANDKIMVCL